MLTLKLREFFDTKFTKIHTVLQSCVNFFKNSYEFSKKFTLTLIFIQKIHTILQSCVNFTQTAFRLIYKLLFAIHFPSYLRTAFCKPLSVFRNPCSVIYQAPKLPPLAAAFEPPPKKPDFAAPLPALAPC